MTVGLDTSIVVRLLTGFPQPLANKALMRVKSVIDAGGVCAVSDLVVAETYFALQYHYSMKKADALKVLRGLSVAQGFSFSPAVRAVLAEPNLEKANPGFIDRVIVGEYTNEGHKVLSCEKTAKKLAGVEVITE